MRLSNTCPRGVCPQCRPPSGGCSEGGGGRGRAGPRRRRAPPIAPSVTPVLVSARQTLRDHLLCESRGAWSVGPVGGGQTALGIMHPSRRRAAFKLRPGGARGADWGQCRGFGALCHRLEGRCGWPERKLEGLSGALRARWDVILRAPRSQPRSQAARRRDPFVGQMRVRTPPGAPALAQVLAASLD